VQALAALRHHAHDGLGRCVGAYGHQLVDSELICVLTRIHLRSAAWLPWAWRAFRRVRRQARQIPELKRAALLVEGPRTLVILSLWSDEGALLKFGTLVDAHLPVVRRALALATRRHGGPQVWSTQWRLYSASNHLRWDHHDDWAELRPTPLVCGRAASPEQAG
jgi:hypothetical protein